MNETKLQSLYNTVGAEFNLGTYDEFKTKMSDDEKRHAFFDAAGEKYNLGTDFSDFDAKYQTAVDEENAHDEIASVAESQQWLPDFTYNHTPDPTGEKDFSDAEAINSMIDNQARNSALSYLGSADGERAASAMFNDKKFREKYKTFADENEEGITKEESEERARKKNDFIADVARANFGKDIDSKTSMSIPEYEALMDKMHYDRIFEYRDKFRKEGMDTGIFGYSLGDNNIISDINAAGMSSLVGMGAEAAKQISLLESIIMSPIKFYDERVLGTKYNNPHYISRFINDAPSIYLDAIGSNFPARSFSSLQDFYYRMSDRNNEGKGIIDYTKEGDFSKAGYELARSVASNTGSLLMSFVTGGLAKIAGKKAILDGNAHNADKIIGEISDVSAYYMGASAAASKWDEIKDDDTLSFPKKAAIVAASFVAECAPEKLGTLRFAKLGQNATGKEIRKYFTGEIGKDLFKWAKKAANSKLATGIGTVADAIIEYGGEGVEESFTEIMNQAVDWSLGKGFNWDAVAESGLVGLVSDPGHIQNAHKAYIRNQINKSPEKTEVGKPLVKFYRDKIESDAWSKKTCEEIGVTPFELAQMITTQKMDGKLSDAKQKKYDQYVEKENAKNNMVFNTTTMCFNLGLKELSSDDSKKRLFGAINTFNRLFLDKGKTIDLESVLSKSPEQMNDAEKEYMTALNNYLSALGRPVIKKISDDGKSIQYIERGIGKKGAVVERPLGGQDISTDDIVMKRGSHIKKGEPVKLMVANENGTATVSQNGKRYDVELTEEAKKKYCPQKEEEKTSEVTDSSNVDGATASTKRDRYSGNVRLAEIKVDVDGKKGQKIKLSGTVVRNEDGSINADETKNLRILDEKGHLISIGTDKYNTYLTALNNALVAERTATNKKTEANASKKKETVAPAPVATSTPAVETTPPVEDAAPAEPASPVETLEDKIKRLAAECPMKGDEIDTEKASPEQQIAWYIENESKESAAELAKEMVDYNQKKVDEVNTKKQEGKIAPDKARSAIRTNTKQIEGWKSASSELLGMTDEDFMTQEEVDARAAEEAARAEAERLAAEKAAKDAEAKRLADEEAARIAAEKKLAEKKRKKAEAEAKRLAKEKRLAEFVPIDLTQDDVVIMMNEKTGPASVIIAKKTTNEDGTITYTRADNGKRVAASFKEQKKDVVYLKDKSGYTPYYLVSKYTSVEIGKNKKNVTVKLMPTKYVGGKFSGSLVSAEAIELYFQKNTDMDLLINNKPSKIDDAIKDSKTLDDALDWSISPFDTMRLTLRDMLSHNLEGDEKTVWEWVRSKIREHIKNEEGFKGLKLEEQYKLFDDKMIETVRMVNQAMSIWNAVIEREGLEEELESKNELLSEQLSIRPSNIERIFINRALSRTGVMTKNVITEVDGKKVEQEVTTKAKYDVAPEERYTYFKELVEFAKELLYSGKGTNVTTDANKIELAQFLAGGRESGGSSGDARSLVLQYLRSKSGLTSRQIAAISKIDGEMSKEELMSDKYGLNEEDLKFFHPEFDASFMAKLNERIGKGKFNLHMPTNLDKDTLSRHGSEKKGLNPIELMKEYLRTLVDLQDIYFDAGNEKSVFKFLDHMNVQLSKTMREVEREKEEKALQKKREDSAKRRKKKEVENDTVEEVGDVEEEHEEGYTNERIEKIKSKIAKEKENPSASVRRDIVYSMLDRMRELQTTISIQEESIARAEDIMTSKDEKEFRRRTAADIIFSARKTIEETNKELQELQKLYNEYNPIETELEKAKSVLEAAKDIAKKKEANKSIQEILDEYDKALPVYKRIKKDAEKRIAEARANGKTPSLQDKKEVEDMEERIKRAATLKREFKKRVKAQSDTASMQKKIDELRAKLDDARDAGDDVVFDKTLKDLDALQAEYDFMVEGHIVTAPAACSRVVDVLESIGVEVEVISEEQMKERMKDAGHNELVDSAGTVLGYFDGKKIVLLRERMNPNTPIHEYTHLWAAAYAMSNPKEWKQMVATLKKSKTWYRMFIDEDAVKESKYKDIIGNEDRMASEVLARITGDYFGQIIGEGEKTRFDQKKNGEYKLEDELIEIKTRGVVEKFWAEVLDWFDAIYTRISGKKSKRSEKRSADEARREEDMLHNEIAKIINKPLDDMLSGQMRMQQGKKELARLIELMSVWHGSAAKFDAFDFSFMSTGEGAQAYGWGGYVSQVKSISIGYAENVRHKANNKIECILADGTKISGNLIDVINRIAEKLDEIGVSLEVSYLQEALYLKENEELKNEVDSFYNRIMIGNAIIQKRENILLKYNDILNKDGETQANDFLEECGFDDIKELTDELKQEKKIVSRLEEKRNTFNYVLTNVLSVESKRYVSLYQVYIPEDNGDNYIGWDDVYKEGDVLYDKIRQFYKYTFDFLDNAVKKGLENGELIESRGRIRNSKTGEVSLIATERSVLADSWRKYCSKNITGEDLYHFVERVLKSNKHASEKLYELGFTGVRVHTNRNTHGTKDKTFNYVMFNQDDMKIIDHTEFMADYLEDEDFDQYGIRPEVLRKIKKEREAIEQVAKETGFMDADGTCYAPNGEKSKLPKDQWVTVRTSRFKEWFGDWENDAENASKAVDENGEPLMVYRGVRAAGKNYFRGTDENKEGDDKRVGIFSTDRRDVANVYASNQEDQKNGVAQPEAEIGEAPKRGEYKPGVYSMFANIKNPLVVDFEGKKWDEYGTPMYEVSTYEYNQKNGIEGEDYIRFNTREEAQEWIRKNGLPEDLFIDEVSKTAADFVQQAMDEGYDGCVFYNIIDGTERLEDPTMTDYVAIESNQFKSANQNAGTFRGDKRDLDFFIVDANNGEYKDNQYFKTVINPKMKKAIRMIKRDASIEEIYEETRIEYNDVTGELDYQLERPIVKADKVVEELIGSDKKKLEVRLGDVIESEIFELIPSLKDMKVRFINDNDASFYGYYSPDKKNITVFINKDTLSKEHTDSGEVPAYVETLLHETQHAIQNYQYSYMGYTGVTETDFDYYYSVMEDMYNRLGDSDVNVQDIMDMISKEAFRCLDRVWYFEDAIQEEEFDSEIAVKSRDEMFESIHSLDIKIESIKKKFGEEIADLAVLAASSRANRYFRSSGEVQARNSSKRAMGVYSTERLPSDTEDVARSSVDHYISYVSEKQIVDAIVGKYGKRIFKEYQKKTSEPEIAVQKMVSDGSVGNRNMEFMIDDSTPLESLTEIDVRLEERNKKVVGETGVVLTNPDVDESVKLGAISEMVTKCLDRCEGIRILQDALGKFRGKKIDASEDVRHAIEGTESRIQVQSDEFQYTKQNEMFERLEALTKLVKGSEMYEKYKKEYYTRFNAINGSETRVDVELTEEEFVERYLIAISNLELDTLGQEMRGAKEFQELMGVDFFTFAKEFESNYSKEAIRGLWDSIKEATDVALDVSYDAGLITGEEYDEYKSRKYYVPNRDFADTRIDEENSIFSRVKRGKKNRPRAFMQRHGGDSLATNVIENILLNTYDAIEKAEQNRAKRVMWDLLVNNEDFRKAVGIPAPKQVYYIRKADGTYERSESSPTAEMRREMAKIKEQIARSKKLLESGTLSEEEKAELKEFIGELKASMPYADIEGARAKYRELNQNAKNASTVGIYIDGVQCEMFFPGMVSVANALNGHMYADESTKYSDVFRTVTNWMSATCTTYNPAFFAVNMVRDIPFILSKGGVEYGLDFQSKFLKNMAHKGETYMTVRKYIKGTLDFDSEEGLQFREFMMNGGNTGYSAIFKMRHARKSVELMGKKSGWEKTKDALSYASEQSEMWTRYAIYKAAIDCGLSTVEAGRAAKNLSVNFNRKGFGGKFFNWLMSLTMFGNAAIQGASGFFRMMGGEVTMQENLKKSFKAIASVAIPMIIEGFWTTKNSLDNPDEEEEWTDWERENYIILGSFKIPLNEQLKPFHVMGMNMAMYWYGGRSGKDVATSICSSMALNWIPFLPKTLSSVSDGIESVGGRKETTLAKMIVNAYTPDALKALNSIANNENFMGGKLRFDIGDKPEYIMSENDPIIYQDIAKLFYWMGGGDTDAPSRSTTSKYTDINPKQIKAIASFIPSGIMNSIETAYAAGRWLETGDNDMSWKSAPIANRFYAPRDVETYRRQKRREAWALVQNHQDIMNNAKEMMSGGNEKAAEIYRREASNTKMIQLEKLLNAYDDISLRRLEQKHGWSHKQFVKKYPNMNLENIDKAEKELIFDITMLLKEIEQK